MARGSQKTHTVRRRSGRPELPAKELAGEEPQERKILVSPGFGAGWTTETTNHKAAQFLLTYQPIIDFLEAGGAFTEKNGALVRRPAQPWERYEEPGQSIIKQLYEDLALHLGDMTEALEFYCGGITELEVRTVRGLVSIRQNDGSEWAVTPDSIRWM